MGALAGSFSAYPLWSCQGRALACHARRGRRSGRLFSADFLRRCVSRAAGGCSLCTGEPLTWLLRRASRRKCPALTFVAVRLHFGPDACWSRWIAMVSAAPPLSPLRSSRLPCAIIFRKPVPALVWGKLRSFDKRSAARSGYLLSALIAPSFEDARARGVDMQSSLDGLDDPGEPGRGRWLNEAERVEAKRRLDAEMLVKHQNGETVPISMRRIDHDGEGFTTSRSVRGGPWSAPRRFIPPVRLVSGGGEPVRQAGHIAVMRGRRAHCGGRRRPGARPGSGSAGDGGPGEPEPGEPARRAVDDDVADRARREAGQ